MTLAQLEVVARLLEIGRFTATPVAEVLRRNNVDPLIQHLLDDEQFYVLLDLKRAERHALQALERLTPQTAYLQPELEQHLCSLQLLLQKMEREEHLRHDCAALAKLHQEDPSSDPSPGVLEWICGKSSS